MPSQSCLRLPYVVAILLGTAVRCGLSMEQQQLQPGSLTGPLRWFEAPPRGPGLEPTSDALKTALDACNNREHHEWESAGDGVRCIFYRHNGAFRNCVSAKPGIRWKEFYVLECDELQALRTRVAMRAHPATSRKERTAQGHRVTTVVTDSMSEAKAPAEPAETEEERSNEAQAAEGAWHDLVRRYQRKQIPGFAAMEGMGWVYIFSTGDDNGQEHERVEDQGWKLHYQPPIDQLAEAVPVIAEFFAGRRSAINHKFVSARIEGRLAASFDPSSGSNLVGKFITIYAPADQIPDVVRGLDAALHAAGVTSTKRQVVPLLDAKVVLPEEGEMPVSGFSVRYGCITAKQKNWLLVPGKKGEKELDARADSEDGRETLAARKCPAMPDWAPPLNGLRLVCPPPGGWWGQQATATQTQTQTPQQQQQQGGGAVEAEAAAAAAAASPRKRPMAARLRNNF